MYIMDMRNGKKTCVRKMTSREILLGLIIPFILFFTGIFSPCFSDSILVWMLSLIPFYGYTVFADDLFREKLTCKNIYLYDITYSGVFSLFIFLSVFLFQDVSECHKAISVLGLINIVPSFAIAGVKSYLPVL